VANVDRCRGSSPKLSSGGSVPLYFVPVLSTLPLSLRGMPVSKAALPYHFMVRLSDEEAEMLRAFSESSGETRSQLIRLLIHNLSAKGLRPGAEAIVFDFATEHTISRNLVAIGTLYNQSVAALNTIAKLVREHPDEASSEEAARILSFVHKDMRYVKDSLECVREDLSALYGKGAIRSGR
jgi:hypothetical protein